MHDSDRDIGIHDIPDWFEGLPLERPLAVFDLEATGTAPFRDRIVEIAIVKIQPEGSKDLLTRRVNPGIPIPPEATEIHGIHDEDVSHEPEFRQIAGELRDYLDGCDLAGFGILMFDLPLLRTEFERADVEFDVSGRRIVDAKTIYHKREPRTLSAAHRFYVGEPFADAHSAAADTLATYRVLLGQLRRYPDLPHSLEGLHRMCNPNEASYVDSEGKLIWKRGEVYFNFGKHRGEPLREVCVTDPSYVDWLTKKDFRAEFKSVLAAALQGQFPEPPAEAG